MVVNLGIVAIYWWERGQMQKVRGQESGGKRKEQ